MFDNDFTARASITIIYYLPVDKCRGHDVCRAIEFIVRQAGRESVVPLLGLTNYRHGDYVWRWKNKQIHRAGNN